MRRSVEGWILMVLSSPFILWALAIACAKVLALITQIPIGYGRIIPSGAELLFIGIFAVPVAMGAYLYVSQSPESNRLWARLAMVVPPIGYLMLWAWNRSWGGELWTADLAWLGAVLLTWISYVSLMVWLARLVVRWQEMYG